MYVHVIVIIKIWLITYNYIGLVSGIKSATLKSLFFIQIKFDLIIMYDRIILCKKFKTHARARARVNLDSNMQKNKKLYYKYAKIII